MEDFQGGKTILIDKPYGWTSFDVVKKIRWQIKQKLGLKKIKVGHAGTLDPLATGLLILCIGKHTKRIEEIMPGVKTYTGTFLLGKTTPSFDLETEFNQEYPTEHITQEKLDFARKKLTGKIEQFPPIFSAKQIDGKRAYDFAREGKPIELKPASIEIFSFEISGNRFPEIDFEISCSKGTYIRSIASDFGKLLDSGATLISLRRTKSGDFNIENAWDPEVITEKIKNGESI
jgi:tRNA pseudouridine55 synthase